jgi:hypothetical protein
MISPPTDRLHKFLAIAGTALFFLGVTIPLDRYDQSVRQFIEAKGKVMELSQAQFRLSKWLDSLKNPPQNDSVTAPADISTPVSSVDRARIEKDSAGLEREIADLSVQTQKQIDLAQHLERIKTTWFVLGFMCILGGIVIATIGFIIWWRQPENER